jgi:hypothetical protein
MRKVELRSYAEIKAKNLREKTAMKRLMAILLGLSVGLTTVAATFAYDGGGIQVQTEKTEKKKGINSEKTEKKKLEKKKRPVL